MSKGETEQTPPTKKTLISQLVLKLECTNTGHSRATAVHTTCSYRTQHHVGMGAILFVTLNMSSGFTFTMLYPKLN